VAQRSNKAIPSLLLATFTSMSGLACSHSSEPFKPEVVKSKTSEKFKVSLGTFQPLKGTPYLMASVSTSTRAWSDKFSSSGAYGTEGQNHNLVFLDTSSLKSQRLFDTNAYVISQTDQFTKQADGKVLTRWLVHQVIKSDTDSNQQLDRNDLLTLGISSPKGEKYVEVLTGITDVFGLTMEAPGKLVVVYGKNGTKSASIIDLDKRSVTATQSIVQLGAEVK
jgi:hypothetical protein